MNLKVISGYFNLKMCSLGLLTFLLLLVTNKNDFERSTLTKSPFDSNILRISYSRVQIPEDDFELIKAGKSSQNPKVKLYRKKLQRSIEVKNDIILYTRILEEITFLDPLLFLNYEVPFFISQQASFIFRLSLF